MELALGFSVTSWFKAVFKRCEEGIDGEPEIGQRAELPEVAQKQRLSVVPS